LNFSSLVYTSLLLIAVGNGFLRACITALGASQYVLPQQKKALDRFFSAYYFFYYAGILMGKILPPYVRTTVLITPYCVQKGECYTSVFGVIVIIFAISWILFLGGLKMYRKETPSLDNTMLKTIDCIAHAVTKKISGKFKEKQILDHAVGKYSQEFVNDVRVFLKIVKFFIPLPIYYALLNQQDSTWTFQAALLNTNIFGIEVQADQFKAIGPILLLILIPVWQKLVNPLLEKCGIFLSSLECVFIGCLFASMSFVCSGFLQYFIKEEFSAKQYSVLWQFPQFFLIMIAEVLISIPGLKFAYTHAPITMKSLLTAIFFINNALGNLLVVGITQLELFNNDHSLEFFFYAFIMLAAAVFIKILSNDNDFEQSASNEDESTFETVIYTDEIQTTNLGENSLNDINV
jgi:dipeptide/tripeptide permease